MIWWWLGSRWWLSSRFNGVQSTGGVRRMGRVWTVPCWIPWMTSTKAMGLWLSGQGERGSQVVLLSSQTDG